MSNSKLVDKIKETTLQLLKEGAGTRATRRATTPAKTETPAIKPTAPTPAAPAAAAPAPPASTKTKDTSDDPTAPIQANPKKPADKPADKPGEKKPGVPHAPGAGTVASFPEVRQMQQAILDFANIASSTDVTAMEGNKEGRQTGDQTRAVPMVGADTLPRQGEENKSEKEGFLSDKQQGELYEQTKNDKKTLRGSDAFGNFIIQNYIPKDSYIGKQYLNVDVAGKDKRENASMPPGDLRGIIDTIKRVGSPNARGEKTTDGVWQNRTNNSLHVIADLVQAMLTFTKDMNMSVPGYTDKDLQTFKSNVPAVYTDVKSPAEFATRAKALTPELIKMTEYFRNLNAKVFNNQQLRTYIDQKQSFTKYDQVPTDPNVLKQSIPINLGGKTTNIYLNNLTSMDAFRRFVNIELGNSVDKTQPEETVQKLLSMVAEQINGKINLGF